MKLITERILIMDVADRWEKEYKYSSDPRILSITESLKKINPEKANSKDVAKIIGNFSWTELSDCTECNQTSDIIVEMGEPIDNDSATVFLCPTCLQKALELIKVNNILK